MPITDDIRLPKILPCGEDRLAFKAQRGQDRWVLDTFNNSAADGGGSSSSGSTGRYFVDLAAQTPACNSNTFALEQRGWHGLCIEANPAYAKQLRMHRSCRVVEAAVDSASHNATFLLLGGYGGLIGDDLDNVVSRPRGVSERSKKLQTRPLVDVLTESRAPSVISYLSLDVEGAEQRVLGVEVLRRFTFLAMTIERPPPLLCRRLFAHGYLFVRNVEFDAHFVHASHPRAAALSRNASFEQLPAKCTKNRPHRVRKMYSKSLGEYPYRCAGPGFFTVESVHMCCEYRGHSFRRTKYGPPTSRWVVMPPGGFGPPQQQEGSRGSRRRQGRRPPSQTIGFRASVLNE